MMSVGFIEFVIVLVLSLVLAYWSHKFPNIMVMSDEKLYLISGYFRVGVKAKTEDEALDKFNKMKIEDMDRLDINDMSEL